MSLLIYNSGTRSPKILKNIPKFKLIIVNFEKKNYLIFKLIQLLLEFFKSVAFFLGHPVFQMRNISLILYYFSLI